MKSKLILLSVILLFSFSSLTEEPKVIKKPLKDYMSFLKVPEDSDIMILNANINGDSENEIFISYTGNRNAKAGNIWTAYLPVEGGFMRWGESICFRTDALFIGYCEQFKGKALITYWPGGGGRGSLIAFQIQDGKLVESSLVIDPGHSEEGRKIYDNIFEKNKPPKIEKIPVSKLASLIEASDKGDILLEPDKTLLSMEDILKLFPERSKIADIPVLAEKNIIDPYKPWIFTMKPGILSADVDGDKEDEIVVAFYTPPHILFLDENGNETNRYEKGFRENSEFFRRAHVGILKKKGSDWELIWQSEGFGMTFGRSNTPAKIMEEELAQEKHNIPEWVFTALDLDGNGASEIIFSRRSFNAEGSEIDIVGWFDGKFENIFTGGGYIEFSNIKSPKCIIKNSHYYSGQTSYGELIFDERSHKFITH